MFNWLTDRKKTKNERDQELLSAYLDGALTRRQQTDLEQRLAQDVDLRAELADLQQVVQRMRSVPAVPLPRNFTLDPAVYGRTKPRRLWYPVLRTASVVTTILLMVVFAGGWLGSAISQLGGFMEAETVVQEVVVTQVVEKEIVVTEIVEMAGEERVVVVEKEIVVTEVVEVEVEAMVEVTATPEPEPEMLAMEEPAEELPPSEPEEESEEEWEDAADTAAMPAEGSVITPTETLLAGDSAGNTESYPVPLPSELPVAPSATAEAMGGSVNTPTPTQAATQAPPTMMSTPAPSSTELPPIATPVPTEASKVVLAPTVTPAPLVAAAPEASGTARDTDDDAAVVPHQGIAPLVLEDEPPIEISWELVAKVGLAILVLGLFVLTWLARRFNW